MVGAFPGLDNRLSGRRAVLPQGPVPLSAASVDLQETTGTIVSTNGCGDAALSASLMALLEGRDLREAAQIGQAASSICARSPKAVNPEMTWDAVRELAFQH